MAEKRKPARGEAERVARDDAVRANNAAKRAAQGKAKSGRAKKEGARVNAKRGGRAKTPRAKTPTAGRVAPRRGRESMAARKQRAAEVLRRLRLEYPAATTALEFRNPFQLLVATILSAQTTDERVNQVTPGLFRRYPTPHDLAAANPSELENIIHSTGFFRNKARSLLGMANAIVDRFGGRVPDTMEELVTLPGVGRKTANVVLGTAFGRNEGVVVDTHVARLSHRLAFTREKEPGRIETDLMKLFPPDDWTELSHTLILHGRAVCKAPRPRCEVCVVNDLCPSSRV